MSKLLIVSLSRSQEEGRMVFMSGEGWSSDLGLARRYDRPEWSSAANGRLWIAEDQVEGDGHWNAVWRSVEGYLSPIISILAGSREEAVKRIGEELQKNPGRLPYHQKWVESGRLVFREVG